ncbi:MAG TPA: hypothetical protein VG271_15135 [Beijerinckiaceae bacterium]|jgi:hypothetical protein|nr:hypothetical protein [Beijerinckiaceae bacterium]
MQALRVVFVVLAVAIAGLLGWRTQNLGPTAQPAVNAPALAQPQASQFPERRRAVENEIASAASYSGFFADLKQDFPADYDRLLNGFAVRAAASGHVESPDLYLAEALRGLRQTRGVLAAQAQAEPLGRVFDVEAQILAKLAETAPPLCVDFLYGGTTASFLGFSGSNRDLMAAMADAALQAILDGQTHHVRRPAPSVDDFNVLEQGLVVRGLDDVEIGALLDGKMPDPPLPAERMCAAGRSYLDALQGLPQDTRLKMLALAVELMARS